MLVDEIMTEAVQIDLRDSIAEAALKMRMAGVGCLVVVNDGVSIGIITERDVALGCPVDGHVPWDCQVFRHMTIQADTAYPSMDTSSATIIMMDNDSSYLPVVEEGSLRGLVSSEDISRATERESAYESEALVR